MWHCRLFKMAVASISLQGSVCIHILWTKIEKDFDDIPDEAVTFAAKKAIIIISVLFRSLLTLHR